MSKTQELIGKLVDGDVERDAIHIAVAPVEAGDYLERGQHIRLRNGKAVECDDDRSIGIVDPFLAKMVEPGEKFFLFLKPNTVTDVKHQWSHPALDNPAAEEDDEDEHEGMDACCPEDFCCAED
jgi:hypothetical protein